jgi:hypothetical protein
MSPEELQKSGESVFYFLAFPNLHNEENLAYLLRNYPSPISNQYEHNGYRLTVYTFNVPLTWTHPPRSLSLSVLPPSQGRPL